MKDEVASMSSLDASLQELFDIEVKVSPTHDDLVKH